MTKHIEYIYQELTALHHPDKTKALQQFDTVLFKHIGHIMHNKVASFWLGLSGARFLKVPGDKHTKKYYRQIARLSVAFAFVADYAFVVLGGALKRKERISGRFADVLSNLYLCSTVLKFYQDQDCPEGDLPLVHWACQQTIYQAQHALLVLFQLLPFKPIAFGLKAIVFPAGKSYSPPGDKLIHQTATILLNDSATRDRLTQGIYINEIENDATGRIECAFKAVLAALPVEQKIRNAQKSKKLPKGLGETVLKQALDRQIINEDEVALVEEAERTRRLAIMVDDFPA